MRLLFKLSAHILEVMGGIDSENWQYFLNLLADGLIEARKHCDTLVTLIKIMGWNATFPCFRQSGGIEKIVKDLRERMLPSVSGERMPHVIERLTKSSGKRRLG